MKSIKSSARKYLIVVSSILVLFCITVVVFVNFSNLPLLKSVDKIVQVQYDYANLDSCIFKLYNAENNCRMYLVSRQRKYYNQFEKEIKEISFIMDTIKQKNQSEYAFLSKDFNGLIKQKKNRTIQFIKLKNLCDSLINFTAKVNQEGEKYRSETKLFTMRQFKNITRVDTIKPRITTVQKKRFLKRVLAALNGNVSKEADTAKPTLIKTTISADTSSINVAYNKLQLNAINDYYLRLYRVNNNLKNKEKQLLNVNHQLISTIVSELKQYKAIEKKYYASLQQISDKTTLGAVENLDKFTKVLLALAIGLLAFVFYMIYHFYKNEKVLISNSNKAASYALSKSRFLANMSHEIRTPLNSIVGFSEQLVQIDLKTEEKEQVVAIRNSSIMLLEVVNDILDFSKYETGKVVLEEVSFSPYTAIKDVFDSMSIQATKKKIGFHLKMSVNEETYILGDPLRLKQVVMNLLSNAIKFTLNGSVTLEVEFTLTNGMPAKLKVNIIDTGLGIKLIDQGIIFDEFAQVYYASTKERQQGTGLGLAICKKIVEFQGGTISVKSTEGEGSVFSFELPYQTSEKPIFIETPISVLPHETTVLIGKRILLADDNMLNILLASTILKKYNICYDAVYNGEEAYELFLEKEYDLILTDIQMPKMGGIELTQKIRNESNVLKRSMPILGITANVLEEDRQKYLASGMNELVLKPFLEHELLEKILKYIR
ncbi:response regulator [Agrobacterium tumefaciens]|nr:response regulator [Agrobacterium tumefaciens]NTE23845.1 response regulator [Agrobacterium tumefaciens]